MSFSRKRPPYKRIYTEAPEDDFREAPRRRKGLGALVFWMIFFGFIISLFILNWPRIRTTMANALWPAWVKSRTPQEETEPFSDFPSQGPFSFGEDAPESPPVMQEPVQVQEPEIPVLPGEPPEPWEETGAPPPAAVSSDPSLVSGGQPPSEAAPAPANPPPSAPGDRTVRPPPPPPIVRDRPLYFIQVDRGGTILRSKVTRTIPSSDAPLLDVLQSLLAGPTPEEQGQGLISLIPAGTKVLSVMVREGTAYISMSEEFQYNTYGVEGYAAQLQQIIWTVTEFPNVKEVQMLVEGRRVDYLGEGIWIGSPISREML